MSINPKNDRNRRKRRQRTTPKRRIDVSTESIAYTNVEYLKKFITERGKILPRRITGMPSKLHRKLTREIKRARNVLLIK